MKVLFNRSACAGMKTGVGHYASQLLEAFDALPGDDEMVCLPSRWLWAAHRACAILAPLVRSWRLRRPRVGRLRLLKPLLKLAALGGHGIHLLGRFVKELEFQAVIRKGRVDLYHEPNFIPFDVDIPTVATFHDLSCVLHPEWHPARRVEHFERHIERSLRQCSQFITVSETVRQEMIRVLNVSPQRITTVHNGVRPELRPLPVEETARMLRKLRQEPGYLLYVGAIEPRKNLLMLLQAYCALPRALRERCPLLLVGPWGWKFQGIADYYQSYARHRGVRRIGYLADAYLPAIYNGARALVYPSFYEGFGLPCVEMMACGGAVVASTADVFTEILGNQALRIPAEDVDAWRGALANIILDDELCYRQLRDGSTAAASRFTWQGCAEKTTEVYRAALGFSRAEPMIHPVDWQDQEAA